MSTLPLAEARARFSQVVDDVVTTHARVEITRNGSRAAVVMSADDYDVLLETLDVLADADLVREVGVALDEAERGEVHALDDVLAEVRARRAR